MLAAMFSVELKAEKKRHRRFSASSYREAIVLAVAPC
jgi:hypothetical protein